MNGVGGDYPKMSAVAFPLVMVCEDRICLLFMEGMEELGRPGMVKCLLSPLELILLTCMCTKERTHIHGDGREK
jgi:hypothetical protein